MSFDVINEVKAIRRIAPMYGLDPSDLAILEAIANYENSGIHTMIRAGKIKDMSFPVSCDESGKIVDREISEKEIVGLDARNFQVFCYAANDQLAFHSGIPKSTFVKRVRKLSERGVIVSIYRSWRDSERVYRRVNLDRIKEMAAALPAFELVWETSRLAKRKEREDALAINPAWVVETIGANDKPIPDEDSDLDLSGIEVDEELTLV